MNILKQTRKPGTFVYPAPAVMVSCGDINNKFNIITIAWTGNINSSPPMCYISVRPERYSYELIKSSMEFVINLTTEKLVEATDFCGIKSGKEIDKFIEAKLTAQRAQIVKCPIIAESPLNIECKVTQIIPLGSHDMFIAEVVAVNLNDDLIDMETGNLLTEKINLIFYANGFYYQSGQILGKYGFLNVQKK